MGGEAYVGRWVCRLGALRLGASTRAVLRLGVSTRAVMLPRILRPRGRADLRDSRGGSSSDSAGPGCWRGRLRLLAAAAAPGCCCGWGGCGWGDGGWGGAWVCGDRPLLVRPGILVVRAICFQCPRCGSGKHIRGSLSRRLTSSGVDDFQEFQMNRAPPLHQYLLVPDCLLQVPPVLLPPLALWPESEKPVLGCLIRKVDDLGLDSPTSLVAERRETRHVKAHDVLATAHLVLL